MKIKKSDLEILQNAIDKVIADNPNAAQDYKDNGLSEKRFRWDVLRATKLNVFGDGRGTHGDLNLYAYLNDSHIDTALKHCLKQ